MTNREKIIELCREYFEKKMNVINELNSVEFNSLLLDDRFHFIDVDVVRISRLVWYYYKEKFGKPEDLVKFWDEEFIDIGINYLGKDF